MRANEFLVEDYEWTQDDGMDFVNPLPVVDDDKYFDIIDAVDNAITAKAKHKPKVGPGYGIFLIKMRDAAGTVQDVPIDKIVSTEKYLDPDKLNAIKNGKNTQKSSEYPIVYKLHNKYITGDGNHRIVGAHLNGEKAVRCLVLDTSRILQ